MIRKIRVDCIKKNWKAVRKLVLVLVLVIVISWIRLDRIRKIKILCRIDMLKGLVLVLVLVLEILELIVLKLS
jgi:hypothetical protein